MARRISLLIAALGLIGFVWPASAQTLEARAYEERIDHLCAHIGLEPDDEPFTQCVITLKYWTDAAGMSGMLQQVPEPPPQGPYTGAYSFFRSPPAEQRAREIFACTGLGIVPDTITLQQCVAAFDAVMSHFELSGAD